MPCPTAARRPCCCPPPLPSRASVPPRCAGVSATANRCSVGSPMPFSPRSAWPTPRRAPEDRRKAGRKRPLFLLFSLGFLLFSFLPVRRFSLPRFICRSLRAQRMPRLFLFCFAFPVFLLFFLTYVITFLVVCLGICLSFQIIFYNFVTSYWS